MRGLAAFVVVLGHIFLMVPETDRLHMSIWLRASPLRILINGHASVILFFVLSGYVLALPFLTGKAGKYSAYVVKRCARIYLPFAAAIVLAAFLYVLSTPVESGTGSAWFHNEWRDQPLTLGLLWNHLAMTGTANEMWLDGVMWSLVVELRISIIFPLLIPLCRRPVRGILTAIAIYLMTTGVMVLNGMPFQTADTFLGTWLVTIRYVPFFMTGILVAKYDTELRDWLSRTAPIWIRGMSLAAIATWYLPDDIHNVHNVSALTTFVSGEDLASLMKVGMDCVLGLSSGLLVLLVRTYGHSSRLLNASPCVWLGKVSYSLYLVHMPVLFWVFRQLDSTCTVVVSAIVSVLASLFIAGMFYKLVELPAIQCGRFLARRWQ